jgi:uncharacterized protein (DUF885 family)
MTGPATSPSESGGRAAADRFGEFADAFVRDSAALTPSFATLLGLHRGRGPGGGEIDLDRELDDLSPAATARRVAFYRAALERLEREFPAESLPRDERVDRGIIAGQCRLALIELDRLRLPQTNPTVAVETIGTALFFPILLEYAEDGERARAIVERLRSVPGFVDAVIAGMTSSAPIYTLVAREENEGNREVIRNALPSLFERAPDLRSDFEAAQAGALQALDRLEVFLARELPRRPAGDWRLGRDRYREKFRAVYGEDLDPDTVLRDAETGIEQVRARMLREAEPLHESFFPGHRGHRTMKDPQARGRTIVREVLERIGREHVPRDRFFDSIRDDVDMLRAFLGSHPIVSLIRTGNLKVIETPPFLRGIYGVAGLHPAPALEPNLPSFFYVTPIPSDWPEDKAESKLREYNRYKTLLLSIHEALPGHYTQLEYANQVRPEWRRVLRGVYGSNANIEGWAQYAEEMMLEQGIVDREDPRMALTFQKEELRLMTNAILDIRLHAGAMTDRQALDLMTRDGFQEREEADAKLRRAKLSSCQLPSYFVGWRAWQRLRRDVQAARGAAFDLRSFHDEVLSAGAIPMPELRRLILPDAPP